MDSRVYTAYEFPFLFIHVSVTIFLSVQLWQKNKTFRTAFYAMFVQQAGAKYIGYTVVRTQPPFSTPLERKPLLSCMLLFSKFLDRFVPNQDPASIDYFIRRAALGFAHGFLLLGDTANAINRLTAMIFPVLHKKVRRWFITTRTASI